MAQPPTHQTLQPAWLIGLVIGALAVVIEVMFVVFQYRDFIPELLTGRHNLRFILIFAIWFVITNIVVLIYRKVKA